MLRYALLAGATAGLGLLVLLRETWPAAPHLSTALTRLTEGPKAAHSRPAEGLEGRLGRLLDLRLRDQRLTFTPFRDLALLRISTESWFGQKALYALIGILFPPLMGLAIHVTGLDLPIAVPTAGSIVLAAALWFVPDLDVRTRAARARVDFARAVTAYLDLTALERAGGSGATQALERAAAVGDSWVFERVREELQRARWAGAAPWGALADLSEDLGVPELQDVADIMRLSGEEGVAVYENLRARSRGMRTALLAREQARANADSERMVIPVALLGLIFLSLLAYPAIVRVL